MSVEPEAQYTQDFELDRPAYVNTSGHAYIEGGTFARIEAMTPAVIQVAGFGTFERVSMRDPHGVPGAVQGNLTAVPLSAVPVLEAAYKRVRAYRETQREEERTRNLERTIMHVLRERHALCLDVAEERAQLCEHLVHALKGHAAL